MRVEHQYAIATASFCSFIASDRFLFRACAEGQGSVLREDGIYAGKFKRSPAANIDLAAFANSNSTHLSWELCAGVLAHMDWQNRRETEWVSLSFSLPWTVHRLFCIRLRSRRLVVVDGRAIANHAETAVRLLQKVAEEMGTSSQVKMARRWAKVAKEVLVYGYVPSSAILCVIDWDTLKKILPSWLRTDVFEKIPYPHRYQPAEASLLQIRRAIAEDKIVEEATNFVYNLFERTSLRSRQPDAVVENMVIGISCWWIHSTTSIAFIREAAQITVKRTRGMNRSCLIASSCAAKPDLELERSLRHVAKPVLAEAPKQPALTIIPCRPQVESEPQLAISSVTGGNDVNKPSDPEPVSDGSQSETNDTRALEERNPEPSLERNLNGKRDHVDIIRDGLSSAGNPYPSGSSFVYDDEDEDEGYQNRSAGYWHEVYFGSNPTLDFALAGLVADKFSFFWR